jgi:hypothetical protein
MDKKRKKKRRKKFHKKLHRKLQFEQKRGCAQEVALGVRSTS